MVHAIFYGQHNGLGSIDRFAPRYLVGNVPNGDDSNAYSTGGFSYFPDPGDGTGIVAALTAAAAKAGRVYVRSGTYNISQILVVPDNTELCGEGLSTRLIATSGALSTAMILLSAGSALRQFYIECNTLAPGGGATTVINFPADAGNYSALCEDLSVVSYDPAPTNASLLGCFGSVGFGGFIPTLRCVRCSVTYGSNSITDPTSNSGLCAFYAEEGRFELLDCVTGFVTGASGPGVRLLTSASQASLSVGALRIEGGSYVAPYRVFDVQVTNNFQPYIVLNSVRLRGTSVPYNANYAGLWVQGAHRVSMTGCWVNMRGNSPIILDGDSATTTASGQIVANNLVCTNTTPWYQGLNDGYHTITSNVYSGAAGVFTANDEVAHNLAL